MYEEAIMEKDETLYKDHQKITKETNQPKKIEKDVKNNNESVHKATLISYLLS